MEEKIKELEEFLKTLDEKTLLAIGLLTGVLQVVERGKGKNKKVYIRVTPPHHFPDAILGDEVNPNTRIYPAVVSTIAQTVQDGELTRRLVSEFFKKYREEKEKENKEEFNFDREKLIKRIAKVLYRQALLRGDEL